MSVIRRGRFVAPLAALFVLAACGGDGPTAAEPPIVAPREVGVPLPVSFAFEVRGERNASGTGTSYATRMVDAYAETDTKGVRVASEVLVIQLGPTVATPGVPPQINLGLIGGEVRVGTYTVRAHQTSPLGSRPEFYAGYRESAGAGRMVEYTATEGTITVSSVSPRIEGTFAFTGGYVIERGLADPNGTKYFPRPASLQATGRFAIQR